MLRRLFFVFSMIFLAGNCLPAYGAVDVIGSIEPKSGDSNTLFKLEVTVSSQSSEEISPPQFSSSDDFVIEARGKKQSMTIINGARSQSISYVFQVTAKKSLQPGVYLLPSGQISVSGQIHRIEPIKITIEPTSTVKRTGPVDFVQIVESLAPYEGEQLTYRCELVSSADIADAVLEETTLPTFFREEFPEHKQVVRRVSNSRVFSIREAIYPNRVGEVEIPERSLTAKVKVENHNKRWGEFFDDLWSDVLDDFNYRPLRISANALKLNVKPLPPKPSGVSGYTPVGRTTISGRLDKTELRAGETALFEIQVESEGNLKPLEFDFSKIIPKNIRIYPEKPEVENTLKDERVFQRKFFRAAIVPEYGGRYEISSPEVSYFDAKSQSYQKAKANGYTLTVGGTAPPKETPSQEVQSEEQIKISEPKIISLPNPRWNKLGISRSSFALMFSLGLIALIFFYWSSLPEAKAEKKRGHREILQEVRASQWQLSGSVRKELEDALASESQVIIALIDRVNFASPDARASAIKDLEDHLKALP